MITTVSLVGFRSHQSTKLELGRLTILVGQHGSGKSSTLDAIALALTGRNRHISGRAEGLREEIAVGKHAFSVDVTLVPGPSVECTAPLRITASFRVIRTVNPSAHTLVFPDCPPQLTAAQATLYAALGTNEDTVTALLDPRLFLDREATDQARFMLKLLRVSDLPVPAEAAKVGVESLPSVDYIDHTVKELKEVRLRDARRAIKNWEAELPPVQGSLLRSAEDIRKTLQECNDVRDELLKAIERATVERDAPKALIIRLAKLTETPLHYDKAKLEGERTGAEEELITLRTKLDGFTAEFNEASGDIKRTNSDTTALDVTLRRYRDLGTNCDTCGQPVSNDFKASLTAKLDEQIKECHAKAKVLFDKQTDLSVCIGDVRNTTRAVESRLRELRTQISNAEAGEKVEASVASLRNDLQAAEVRANEAVERLAIDQRKLSDVSGKRVGLTADLENAVREESDAAKRTDLLEKIATARTGAEALEQAVQALLRLKQEVLEQNLQPFINLMEGFLGAFGLAKLRVDLTPFAFSIQGVPASRLSGGQRIIFDAALRYACAKRSGFGTIALDDINKLGEQTRVRLVSTLALAGTQVIVCATLDKPPEVGKVPEGVKYLWFENSTLIGPSRVHELGEATPTGA